MNTTQLFYLTGVGAGIIIRTVGPWLLGVFGGLEKFDWAYLKSAVIGAVVASGGAWLLPELGEVNNVGALAVGVAFGFNSQTGARHVETRVVR